MDKQQIKDILELFEQSTVAKMELEINSLKIKLEKYQAYSGNTCNEQQTSKLMNSIVNDNTLHKTNEAKDTNNETSKTDTESNASTSVHIITAPLVGTFYASRQQDGPSFVSVGSKVAQGDVLCIVEAMKVMNEIRADKAGTIKEIRVANEDMVQFKQPLFVLED